VTALWDRGRPVYGISGHAAAAAPTARLAVYLGDVSATAAADRRNVGDARSSVVDMLTTIRLNGPACSYDRRRSQDITLAPMAAKRYAPALRPFRPFSVAIWPL